MSRARQTKVAAATVGALIALSGCQAIFHGGNRLADSSGVLHQPLPADFGARQIELGRTALKNGDTAGAIDAFMVARLYPDQAAAAFNGLAVAYSRLGRTDLTERFFHNAIMLAPAEDRYRANLAVFYSRNGIPRTAEPPVALAQASGPAHTPAPVPAPAVADGELPAIAPLAAPVITIPAARPQLAIHRVEPARVQQLGEGITAHGGGAGMTRISRNEVLVGGGGTAAPARTVQARRAVEVHVGARNPANPGAQVALSAPRRAPAYPVRITFGN